MDFVNPPPPRRTGALQGLLDLPTHLPNDAPLTGPETASLLGPVEEPIRDETVDDEESTHATPSSEPVFIPGTNITLQTEEDIRKWIEDRKKNWPSRKNIASKEEGKQQKAPEPRGNNKRESDDPTGNKKKPKSLCRFFLQYGHCKFGNKCKNVHETPTTGVTVSNEHDATHYKRQINGIPVLIPKLYSKRQSLGPNGSLFKSLVQKELAENENSVVLDFVQYLDKQGLINHDVMKNTTKPTK
ncbi:uncharacterized protein CANTADRAFT_53461 [Suhomyces tanzawaensis NRRL Y-17324]|uniref:C3H1-type domain-containing protein n=1 Tax=Suhomyces tanzawaensis NRRL Y-17324 TaxID=984487 RepID=A0A1E4SG06_9ASCO|nr:uncharacterized protein CANTADRAFT_53461 [Suhomyces tanzawaensis NRRL Y-17324]ODV78444.1 hypothetical protein CANTADRAFT_53461 [Suhomyces tanzawaensis NRRL Y-17324]